MLLQEGGGAWQRVGGSGGHGAGRTGGQEWGARGRVLTAVAVDLHVQEQLVLFGAPERAGRTHRQAHVQCQGSATAHSKAA